MPHFLSRDSNVIHFDDQGAGPPMVFLHGWSLSGAVWRPQVESLSSRYRCLTMDLRGHGLSGAPDSGYRLEDLASDVAGLFAHLELSGAAVVGWSLGAVVALAAYPLLHEKLAGMALVSGTPKFTAIPEYSCALSPKEPRVLGLRLKKDFTKACEGFFQGMFTREEVSSAEYERIETEYFREAERPQYHAAVQTLDTLSAADVRGSLAAIDVPVLLAHGSCDAICPAAASRWMAERIPDAMLKILDRAGHAPMLTRPTELNGILNTFLERVYEGDR